MNKQQFEIEKSAGQENCKQHAAILAKKIMEQNQEFCIIGLTGKIKSGTSDVCALLENPDFSNIVTQPANTQGFSMSEIREHKVIYRYLQHNWRPFIILEATSVILSFLLDSTEEDLLNDEKGKRVGEIIEKILTSQSEQFLYQIIEKVKKTDFTIQYQSKQTADSRQTDLSVVRTNCKIIMKDIQNLSALLRYWSNIYNDLKANRFSTKIFIFCYGILPVLDGFIKTELDKNFSYASFFQDFGNNIRASGNAVNIDDITDAKNLFSLSERINQFVKILRNYPDYLSEDIDVLWKSGRKHAAFIVINNFKNIFEAYYFKKRYTVFYLMAVSCDEKARQSQFASPSKCKLADLKENYSKGKKVYNIVSKELNSNPTEKIENYFQDDQKENLCKKLGISSEDFDFVSEIFISNNFLRKISYEQKVAQFILQDVMTCIENADIFVTRNYKEADYKCDYPLIRLLGRIVTLILHPGLLTPTKLERCMQIAMTAKLNSGCLSRQVGAVVTDSDYNILSLGWNDSPCGIESCIRRNLFDLFRKQDNEAYSEYELNDSEFRIYIDKINKNFPIAKDDLGGLPLAFCFKDIYQDIIKQRDQIYTRALHGEERALAMCGNERAEGGYLFTTSIPCELCAKKIKEANISKIYYIEQYPGISQTHIINVGQKRAQYEFFVGAVGSAYVKLYTPLMPYKDELEALHFSPVAIHGKES